LLETIPVGKQTFDREFEWQEVVRESRHTFLMPPAERIWHLLHVSWGDDCRQPGTLQIFFPSPRTK
jgi:hypothetical protein